MENLSNMHISFFAKLIFFLSIYCISDIAIKNKVMKNAIRKAQRAKPIN
tara:strand:- start:926 stop:1072 length:147 start_codon:yes stop_codon:yes gene_type:complete